MYKRVVVVKNQKETFKNWNIFYNTQVICFNNKFKYPAQNEKGNNESNNI